MNTGTNHGTKGLFSVVIHDVAPATWPACHRVIKAVRDVAPDIPLTLLVVPRYHMQPSDRGFERIMEKLLGKGHELALHGYVHLDEGEPANWRDHIRRRWYTAGEGEFSALSESEALHKLHAGVRWFERRQWPLHGFIAPAWLMSRGTWKAMMQMPLRYTATRTDVYSLPRATRQPSDCLAFSTRSLWRRVASLPRNAWVAAGWHEQSLVRLELHPHDADYPLIRSCWQHELVRLVQERRAATMADAMAGLHPEPASATPFATRVPAANSEVFSASFAWMRRNAGMRRDAR